MPSTEARQEAKEEANKKVNTTIRQPASYPPSEPLIESYSRRSHAERPGITATPWTATPWIATPWIAAFGVALMGVVCAGAAQAQTRLPARDLEQVPTARYGRGEAVDLSLIVEEWRDRYPAIPVFTCSCNAQTGGDEAVWPFKSFTRYQPFLALGDFNAANNEETGFNCFDIATGDRPSP